MSMNNFNDTIRNRTRVVLRVFVTNILRYLLIFRQGVSHSN